MKLMQWWLGFGPALLQKAAAAPASSNNHETKHLGHIVVLKQGLQNEHIDKHIDWVNDMHKESIGFHGYAGKFSDGVLRKIQGHEHVDFVEEDRIITVEPSKREKIESNKSPKIAGNQNKNEAIGLLTRGQGYNSFLQKGRIVDAIIWPNNGKRDLANESVIPAGNESLEDETMTFNFTPPNTEVEDFKGVNLEEYFEPPEETEIMDRVAAKLKELKEQRKKETEEKAKMTETNEIHTRADDGKCPGNLRKEYKFTEDYNSYLQALGISGGATISGWGQSASVSGNYLNQAKFSKNSLTYIASLDVERQLTTPGGFEFNKERYRRGKFAQQFGDRWIHGFKTGGKMIAHVTFTSKDDTKTTDLKAHAEASLSFWGVKGDVSADVKKSMDEVNKHTNVEVSLFYQGDLGIFMENLEGAPKDIPSGSADAVLGQVKSWSDKFESYACKHDYAYGPLLNEYDIIPGFHDLEDAPEALDYDIAHLYALEILSLLVKIEEQKKILLTSPNLAVNDRVKITRDAINLIKESKKWVKLAERDPTKAEREAIRLITRLSNKFIKKHKASLAEAFALIKQLGTDLRDPRPQ